jgi:hypothetical protein
MSGVRMSDGQSGQALPRAILDLWCEEKRP